MFKDRSIPHPLLFPEDWHAMQWPVVRGSWIPWLAAAAGVGGTLLAYAFWVEPLAIELEWLRVQLPRAAGRLPQAGLRILHLSDSHFQGGKRSAREQAKIDRIRRLTAGLEYDLLVHTGDFIHYDGGADHVLRLLDALPRPRLGAYGVLGNHDYTHYAIQEALPRMWRTYRAAEQAADRQRVAATRLLAMATRWLRYIVYVRNTPLDGRRVGSNDTDRLATALEQWGMTLLHNQTRHLTDRQSGLDIYLAGVDDLVEGQPQFEASLRSVPLGAPVLLLSHNPDLVASPLLSRVSLMLAGHTHGGQIRLPLWGPAHTQVEHLQRHQVSGSFRQGETEIYISRGIGEGIPLRFCASPQIALLQVHG
jgi:predicted MPP superfamily phosphohydrolase